MNEENIGKVKVELGVQNALLRHRARNIKSVLPLIDFDRINNENGELSGIEEQIEELKNSDDTAFLFEKGDKRVKGVKAEESGDAGRKPKNGKMTYTQMCRLFS